MAIASIAPPDRLIVDAASLVRHPPLASEATGALAAIVAAIVAGIRLHRAERLAPPAALIAGSLVVYLLSVAVVDHRAGYFRRPSGYVRRSVAAPFLVRRCAPR